MASDRGRVDRLALSLSNMSRLRPSRLASLARSAEEHGFRHLAFNESYNDVIAYLVAAASATDRATLPAYLNFDGNGRHLASLGYEAAVSQVRSLVRAGDHTAATRAVPDELVDRVAAYGPAERIWTPIEQLLAAKVDLIVLSPRLGHRPWDEAYEQVIGVLGAPRR